MTALAPNTLRQLRRAQIIKAARRLVAERGLSALTFGALESSLDFSRGVITYHFKNKDEIVIAVLESAINEIDAATEALVKDSHTLTGKVAAVVRANVRGYLDNAEASRILLSFWGRLQADDRIRDLNAQLYTRYREQTRQLILHGQRSGAFRQDLDTHTAATIFVGLVMGIATQAIFDPDTIDVETAITEAGAMLDASFASLTALGRP